MGPWIGKGLALPVRVQPDSCSLFAVFLNQRIRGWQDWIRQPFLGKEAAGDITPPPPCLPLMGQPAPSPGTSLLVEVWGEGSSALLAVGALAGGSPLSVTSQPPPSWAASASPSPAPSHLQAREPHLYCFGASFIPRPGLGDLGFLVASQSSFCLTQGPNHWNPRSPCPEGAIPRGP